MSKSVPEVLRKANAIAEKELEIFHRAIGELQQEKRAMSKQTAIDEWQTQQSRSMKTMTKDDAAKLLREAATLVEGARAEDYGDFLDNVTHAAAVSGTTPSQCARALIGIKSARLHTSHFHHDSMVDFLGYCALTLTTFGHFSEDPK